MKSLGTAYVLFLFGIHRFYLEKPISGFLYLITCGGVGLWMLLDLFTLPTQVNHFNIVADFKYRRRKYN